MIISTGGNLKQQRRGSPSEKLTRSVLSMEPSRTDLYSEFLAERQQILCHKWIESEKAGYDIGFERALLDWTVKYRSAWSEKRRLLVRCHQTRG
jgi:hypothetical protein